MAKKKKRRRKQGVVSWLTSIIALGIGLSGVFSTLRVHGWDGLTNRASFGLVRQGQFNLKEGLILYGPILGGILFKVITGELAKRARVQAILPALR